MTYRQEALGMSQDERDELWRAQRALANLLARFYSRTAKLPADLRLSLDFGDVTLSFGERKQPNITFYAGHCCAFCKAPIVHHLRHEDVSTKNGPTHIEYSVFYCARKECPAHVGSMAFNDAQKPSWMLNENEIA